MLGCKHPNIASGATPIGSAVAHPIEKEKEGKEVSIYVVQENFEVYKFLSLCPDASTRPKPRGLLPSGALVAHPMEIFSKKSN